MDRCIYRQTDRLIDESIDQAYFQRDGQGEQKEYAKMVKHSQRDSRPHNLSEPYWLSVSNVK